MNSLDMEEKVNAVRSFNRFYTRQIGILQEGILQTPFPLTEARILFELARHNSLTPTKLRHELGLDAGYLSRTIAHLEQQHLVARVRSEQDGRQVFLHLTPEGEQAFATLNQRSSDDVAAMLNNLPEENQQSLLEAMHSIENILDKDKKSNPKSPLILRDPEPGDMGWVVYRHGLLYAREYGWDNTFEALVARIVADFVDKFNPARERCWIAEMDGEIIGSVFVVQLDETTAKLRLLLVEPKARGLGLGTRLVEECIRFARRTGYKKLTLWTNSILLGARHIYHKTGFKIVAQENHHSFGHDLVSETWELEL
jgi:DNA-binding MarR family transcriptional regulator/GNAT superfamily N-acetyltransferase